MGNPKYIYGQEDIKKYIMYKNCNILYVHHTITYNYDNHVVLHSNDTYGKLIQQYGGVILVAYYTMLEEEEEEGEQI